MKNISQNTYGLSGRSASIKLSLQKYFDSKMQVDESNCIVLFLFNYMIENTRIIIQ